MLPLNLSHSRFAYLLVVALAVTVPLLPVGQVNGNGIHTSNQQVFAGESDPYNIIVETVPRVGNLHLVVYIAQLSNLAPVTDANIEVVGTRPGESGETVGPVAGRGPTIAGTNAYSVNVPAEQAGEWAFTMTVEASAGRTTVNFVVQVRDTGGTNWTLIGAVVVFVLAAGWAVFTWIRSERRRQAGC